MRRTLPLLRQPSPQTQRCSRWIRMTSGSSAALPSPRGPRCAAEHPGRIGRATGDPGDLAGDRAGGDGLVRIGQDNVLAGGHATGRSGFSSGLGLSIVRGIVEAHAEEVELISAPGVGTTVRVRLPLAGAANQPHTMTPSGCLRTVPAQDRSWPCIVPRTTTWSPARWSGRTRCCSPCGPDLDAVRPLAYPREDQQSISLLTWRMHDARTECQGCNRGRAS